MGPAQGRGGVMRTLKLEQSTNYSRDVHICLFYYSIRFYLCRMSVYLQTFRCRNLKQVIPGSTTSTTFVNVNYQKCFNIQ